MIYLKIFRLHFLNCALLCWWSCSFWWRSGNYYHRFINNSNTNFKLRWASTQTLLYVVNIYLFHNDVFYLLLDLLIHGENSCIHNIYSNDSVPRFCTGRTINNKTLVLRAIKNRTATSKSSTILLVIAHFHRRWFKRWHSSKYHWRLVLFKNMLVNFGTLLKIMLCNQTVIYLHENKTRKFSFSQRTQRAFHLFYYAQIFYQTLSAKR